MEFLLIDVSMSLSALAHCDGNTDQAQPKRGAHSEVVAASLVASRNTPYTGQCGCSVP